MHRILMKSALCVIVLLMAGCSHPAFRSAVDNGTTEKVYAVIHFNDASIPPGHGYIEPGNGVNLTQKIDDIRYIEYRFPHHQCRMDASSITKAAKTGPEGVTKITLQGCASSNP